MNCPPIRPPSPVVITALTGRLSAFGSGSCASKAGMIAGRRRTRGLKWREARHGRLHARAGLWPDCGTPSQLFRAMAPIRPTSRAQPKGLAGCVAPNGDGRPLGASAGGRRHLLRDCPRQRWALSPVRLPRSPRWQTRALKASGSRSGPQRSLHGGGQTRHSFIAPRRFRVQGSDRGRNRSDVGCSAKDNQPA